jgi:hypothetical protein
MRPIIFPTAILSVQTTSGYSADNSGLILEGDIGSTNDVQFYWLDFQHKVVHNYCFDHGIPFSVSLDGKFISFVRQSLPHTLPVPKSTYILNLATGYYSEIAHFVFMAWAQSRQ